MADDYLKALKSGQQAFGKAVREGRHPHLPVLDEFLDDSRCSRLLLGTMEIPLSQVIGTKTAGRQSVFACNFMPLMDRDSEFGQKWLRLYESQLEEGIRDPIVVFEYLHCFYVQEGNKRVSVAKYLEMPTVPAVVTRLVPAEEDTGVYGEFLKFYSVCPLYELNFSKEGSYLSFAKSLDLDLKTKWDEMIVKQVRSAYYNFHKAWIQTAGIPDYYNESDAMLIYISVYDLEKLRWQSVQTVRKNIARIRREMITQAGDGQIVLREEPPEKNDSALRRILPGYSESKPLRIAFVFDDNGDDSAWVFDHEIGVHYLKKRYPDIVKTDVYENCSEDDITEKVLAEAAQDHDLIFTVSPGLMPETLKAAIRYPSVRFLNCSINLSVNAVRTYYVRMYELKFLLGALAAMSTEKHRICYIADYPIYGTIASINAFAIGASLIDPEMKVYLGWSGVHDQDWFSELDYLDVDVFSAPDLPMVILDNPLFGVCRKEKDGSITNLAVPVTVWTNYYDKLVGSVLDGSFEKDGEAAKKSINYWWGMKAGVADLELSSKIPYSSAKMIRLMKENLIEGTFTPFSGELRSQNGRIQSEKDGRLSQEEIIRMDWLNENIIGVIPEYSSMRRGAQKLVSVSGVRGAKEKA